MEDSSAWELSNITLPDDSEDIPQMDQFGECSWGSVPVPPTASSHTEAAPCNEEVMEQELPKEERECSEYTEEGESPVSSLWNSTNSDRHTEEEDFPESSPWNSADSDRQTEEEEEGELSDEPAGEPTDGPADETAVKLIEGHPPDDELMETITVECPTSEWELPPGGTQEEDRVVVHASKDEMDHLC